MTSSRYIDIPLSLKTGLITDEEVVKQRLRLLLTTEPGSLLDLPTWGCPITPYLYEGINEGALDRIYMAVKRTINTWMESSIRIDKIDVKADYDDNQVSVELGLFLIEFNKNVLMTQYFNAA
jgi:phage baseplate assembly protein W